MTHHTGLASKEQKNHSFTQGEPPLGRDLVLLLLACAALWGWTYGLGDFWGPDEPRYVQIARELLERANWLILTIMGEPYDQKPPLPYWMIAAMLKLNGGEVTSWAARLPSVLFGTLTVLLTYLIGRRRLGRGAGWLAAWVLITSPMFLEEVPTARLDILLTGWVALAMAVWLARRPGEGPLGLGRCALFWLALTGAFFIKGPVVWLIVLVPVLLESIWRRSWQPLLDLRPFWGVPLMLAPIGAWLAAEWMLISPEFVLAQLKTATVERVVNPTMHRQPVYYYVLGVLGEGFMPWSLAAVAALVALWRARRHPPADWLALRPILLWALWSFLAFSLVGTKREQYLLPIYPALALLAGWFLDRGLARWSVPAWGRRLGAGLALAAGGVLMALAAAMLAGADPFAARNPEVSGELALLRGARFFAPRMAAVGLLGLALATSAVVWLKAAEGRQAFRLLLGTIFVIGVCALGVGKPLMNPLKSTREINRAIQALVRAPGEAVGALGDTYKAQYMVYSTYRLEDLDSDPEDLHARGEKLPRIIFGETSGKNRKKWSKIEPVLRGLGYAPAWSTPAQEGLTVYARP